MVQRGDRLESTIEDNAVIEFVSQALHLLGFSGELKVKCDRVEENYYNDTSNLGNGTPGPFLLNFKTERSTRTKMLFIFVKENDRTVDMSNGVVE